MQLYAFSEMLSNEANSWGCYIDLCTDAGAEEVTKRLHATVAVCDGVKE